MRNGWITAAGFLALAGLATPAPGEPDPFIEIMKERGKQSCADTDTMECIGIGSGTCKEAIESSVETCAARVSEPRSEAFSECQISTFSDAVGVAENRIEACGRKHVDRNQTTRRPESVEQAYQQAEQNLKQITTAIKKASASVPKSRVTLPLYPGHEVIYHYPSSSRMLSNRETYGENPVSMIKLTTSDSRSEVIAFYKRELSGFTGEDNLYGYTFSRNGLPEKQAPKAMMKAMTQQEHISIVNAGDETHIEIGYRE